MRLLVVTLICAVFAAGCTNGGALDTPTLPSVTTPDITLPPTLPTTILTPDPQQPRDGPLFDGARAMEWVRAHVLHEDGSVRYRVPGTAGNDEVAHLVTDAMRAMNYTVTWHHFNATYGCETVPMHNVIAERAGTSGEVVMFAAHYDTRPIAEKDPDPDRRDDPIAGANDGASGVAVLLELARVLPPSNDTVRFVFFDGEDGGRYKGVECTDWILGSTAYNASLTDEERDAIRAFILVDMVGDHRLELPWELYSRNGPGRAVQERVYEVGNGLGHRQFKNETGYAITDDHKPFVDAGVPAIDLIHLTKDGLVFPDTHHTHADDLEHVSEPSLAAVGRTLEWWFFELPQSSP